VAGGGVVQTSAGACWTLRREGAGGPAALPSADAGDGGRPADHAWTMEGLAQLTRLYPP